MVQLIDRIPRHPELVGEDRLRHPGEFRQDRCALTRRQIVLDRTAKNLEQLPSIRRIGSRRCRADRRVRPIIQPEVRQRAFAPRSFSHRGKRDAERHRHRPRRESAVAAKRVDLVEHTENPVLGEIVDIRRGHRCPVGQGAAETTAEKFRQVCERGGKVRVRSVRKHFEPLGIGSVGRGHDWRIIGRAGCIEKIWKAT